MSVITTLTDISVDWGRRCFGSQHMADSKVRAIRLVEEVVELAQSLAVPEEQILKLVKVVFSRPPGRTYQEVGGSMVTLAVLCNCLGIDLEEAFEIEIRRCLAKTPGEFAERNRQKLYLGLTGGE